MITPRRLIAGYALTTSWAYPYQVPAAVLSSTAKQLIVCNTDTVIRTFYYAVTATTGAPSVAQTLFNAVTLQVNESKVFGLTDVMPAGYYIQCKAGEAGGGNLVSLSVSGMEST
jgi:hypothetical protein